MRKPKKVASSSRTVLEKYISSPFLENFHKEIFSRKSRNRSPVRAVPYQNSILACSSRSITRRKPKKAPVQSQFEPYYTVVFQFAARKVYHEENRKRSPVRAVLQYSSLWLEKYHEEKAEKKDRQLEHIPACGLNCVAMRKVRNKRLIWFFFCSSLFCDLRVKILQFCPFVRC